MYKDEKGFTYPITLSLLLSMCILLGASSELLLVEQKMAREAESMYLQEYYLLSSLKKVERSLQDGNGTPVSGNHYYSEGAVQYQTVTESGGGLKVTFRVWVHHNTDFFEGYGFYNPNQKKMVKWMEKN
jgi:ComG operon protein 7